MSRRLLVPFVAVSLLFAGIGLVYAQNPCSFTSPGASGPITETCGAVGIGTTAPDKSLQVITGSSGNGIEVANTSGPTRHEVTMTIDGTYAYLDAYNVGGPAPYPLKIQVNGGNTLLNPGFGNVGVGTSSPTNTLNVYSTANVGGITVDGTQNPGLTFKQNGTVVGYYSTPTMSGNFFTDSMQYDLVFRSESHSILFGQGSGISTMAVAGNKVGIGTTNPTATLEVNGTIKAHL